MVLPRFVMIRKKIITKTFAIKFLRQFKRKLLEIFVMYRLAGVFSIFLCALSWLYFLATNAPTLPENESLEFPSSLEDLKKTAAILTKLFDHVSYFRVLRSHGILNDL